MWKDEDGDHLDEVPDSPSKTQRKRESEALQDLGVKLLELPPEHLVRLDLPANLSEAIRIGQSITSHGASRRQRKYIGKLLRGLDVEPIRAGLAALKGEGVEAVRRLHVLERWRDRMITEGDDAVNDFVAGHPEADRQKLRQLVRDVQKERELARPPRAARQLFRHLRELVEAE